MLVERIIQYAVDSPLDRGEITRRLRTLLGHRRDEELAWQLFAPRGVLYSGEAGPAGFTMERDPDVGRRYVRFDGAYIPAPAGTRISIEVTIVGRPGTGRLGAVAGVLGPLAMVLGMLATFLPGPRPVLWSCAAASLLLIAPAVLRVRRLAARMLAEDRAAIERLLTMSPEEASLEIDRRRRESGRLMRIRVVGAPIGRMTFPTPLTGDEIVHRFSHLCDGNRVYMEPGSRHLPQFEGIVEKGSFMLRETTDGVDVPFITGEWSEHGGIATVTAELYLDDPREPWFWWGIVAIAIGLVIVIIDGRAVAAGVIGAIVSMITLIFGGGWRRRDRHNYTLGYQRFLASVLDPDRRAPGSAGGDGASGDGGSDGPPDEPCSPVGPDIPEYASPVQS